MHVWGQTFFAFVGESGNETKPHSLALGGVAQLRERRVVLPSMYLLHLPHLHQSILLYLWKVSVILGVNMAETSPVNCSLWKLYTRVAPICTVVTAKTGVRKFWPLFLLLDCLPALENDSSPFDCTGNQPMAIDYTHLFFDPIIILYGRMQTAAPLLP